MQKKYTLAIVIIVILAIGIIFMKNNKSEEVKTLDENNISVVEVNNQENILSEELPMTATVTYTDQGYSPETVTIAKGGSVTFINKSSGKISTASDSHPSHTIYPEFDQYKTSSRGQNEFTFVFENAGSWKYHNHLNPSGVGTVIVK